MTVHALARSAGRHGWTVRCELCEHTFDAAVGGQADALAFARTNGWIVDEVAWCPMCASARSHRTA